MLLAEGRRSLKIEGVLVKDAKCNPPWPVVVSTDVAAQPGHAYRLTKKMKAAKAGIRVELMIQSYVANVYFWSRNTSAGLGPDWKEYELVFKLAAVTTVFLAAATAQAADAPLVTQTQRDDFFGYPGHGDPHQSPLAALQPFAGNNVRAGKRITPCWLGAAASRYARA